MEKTKTQLHHDEVREEISKEFQNWKNIKKQFVETSKTNRNLFLVLRLVILGDSLLFLLLVGFFAYWYSHPL